MLLLLGSYELLLPNVCELLLEMLGSYELLLPSACKRMLAILVRLHM